MTNKTTRVFAGKNWVRSLELTPTPKRSTYALVSLDYPVDYRVNLRVFCHNFRIDDFFYSFEDGDLPAIFLIINKDPRVAP